MSYEDENVERSVVLTNKSWNKVGLLSKGLLSVIDRNDLDLADLEVGDLETYVTKSHSHDHGSQIMVARNKNGDCKIMMTRPISKSEESEAASKMEEDAEDPLSALIEKVLGVENLSMKYIEKTRTNDSFHEDIDDIVSELMSEVKGKDE